MTITISLSPEEERRLKEWANLNGLDVNSYVGLIISKFAQKTPSGDDALAPFRRQVAESGMTDAELEAFFDEVREEVWQEKQAVAPEDA
jgi:hypothetical protein